MATVEAPVEIKATNEDEFINAQKVFQTGKKNLFLNKYDESVNNIGDACKIYSAKFGEMDSQCAEIYFFYGRALLELARVENTVLGNALDGVPEDETPINDSRYGNPDDVAEDEQDDITEKVIDALCEERKPETTTEATTTTATPVEEATKTTTATEEQAKTEITPAVVVAAVVEEAKVLEATKVEVVKVEEAKVLEATKVEEKVETTEEKAKTEEGEEGEDSEDEEDEEEVEGDDLTKSEEQEAKEDAEFEDISNLQRAWEMFELAKVVYTQHFDNDLVFKNKRIAECLLKLGEISIEQEIYEQAITDISESIRIQEEQKENRDERMLAESFYQLGLCQQFNNMYKEANETYQKSSNILQLTIEKLKGKIELIKDDKEQEAEYNSLKEEVTELEALLPEMICKLEECNEQGEKSLLLIKEAKEMMMNTIAPTETTATSITKAPACVGEVKDITNMVKSKRKFDATDDTVSVKKTRLSENGSDAAIENSEPVMDTTEVTKTEEKIAIVEQVAEPMSETVTAITV